MKHCGGHHKQMKKIGHHSDVRLKTKTDQGVCQETYSPIKGAAGISGQSLHVPKISCMLMSGLWGRVAKCMPFVTVKHVVAASCSGAASFQLGHCL